MNQAKSLVLRVALALGRSGKTMPAPDLVPMLNAAGIRTTRGVPYTGGGRGIYTLVRATYDELVGLGRQADADAVAAAFTRPDGSYAYN